MVGADIHQERRALAFDEGIAIGHFPRSLVMRAVDDAGNRRRRHIGVFHNPDRIIRHRTVLPFSLRRPIGQLRTQAFATKPPPSITTACPVMKDAASELRNSTSWAISFGSLMRPIGIRGMTVSLAPCSLPNILVSSGVITEPGAMALTRIFFFAASSATELVSPITPHLDAQ